MEVRRERLRLLDRVLKAQREFYEMWGRWPTCEEVALAIDGP